MTKTPTNDDSLRFVCPQCQTWLKTSRSAAGSRHHCPCCHLAIEVPCEPSTSDRRDEYALHPEGTGPSVVQQATYIPVICHLCHTRMYATTDQVGTTMTCPDCGATTLVPPSPFRPPKIDVMAGADDDGYRLCDAALPPSPTPPPPTPEEQTPVSRKKKKKVSRRKPLPEHPFLSGTFSFPFSSGTLGVVIALLGWEAVVQWLLVINFQFRQSQDPRALFAAAMFGGIAGILGLGLLTYASACALAIVRDTANSADQIQEWPGLSFLEWLFAGLYLVGSFVMSLLPGCAVTGLLHKASPLATLALPVSAFVMFPLLLMSTLENGTPFGLISLPVYRTLWTSRKGWMAFYGLTAMLILDAVALTIVAYWIHPLAATVVAALVQVIGWFIYFRLLGRLGWYCADRSFRAAEAAENAEEEDDEDDA
ncbi:MAG: hypothetical protein LLF97_02450 [Planctomycetaceae bacterium]|nr:hypothetical protein [Planctomycetaceae bacterium]